MPQKFCRKKVGLKRSATNENIRDLFKHFKAHKLLRNTDKREHVKNQTARWLSMDVLPLTTVELKCYFHSIESIDSTMKSFSNVTMKDTIRSLEDNICDAIVQRATGF